MKFNIYPTLRALLLIFISLVLGTLLLNTLYYFDILSNNMIKYGKILISILSFFLGGIYLGRNSPNKGYLYGIRLSIIVIIIYIVFGIIFNNITLSRIIFYLIVSFCITFGAMIGINKKN